MEAWRRILADSIVKPKDLADRLGVDAKEIEAIVGDYPMRITPTVMATIKEKGDAIWKQVVPDIAEMEDFEAADDPLEEDLMSPVPAFCLSLSGSRPANGHKPVSDLLSVLHEKTAGRETGIPQERRTRPGDRLLARTY